MMSKMCIVVVLEFVHWCCYVWYCSFFPGSRSLMMVESQRVVKLQEVFTIMICTLGTSRFTIQFIEPCNLVCVISLPPPPISHNKQPNRESFPTPACHPKILLGGQMSDCKKAIFLVCVSTLRLY
jgi:hypothetical protein